jgi:glycerol kinase
MQFQADILQSNVIRPKITETTALGAAYLAGLTSGYWKDRDEIIKNWSEERKFIPLSDKEKVVKQISGWKKL